jgi:hypothetical protein
MSVAQLASVKREPYVASGVGGTINHVNFSPLSPVYHFDFKQQFLSSPTDFTKKQGKTKISV